MKNYRAFFFGLALLLCAGALLTGCSNGVDITSSEETKRTDPTPVIEHFDSFAAYTEALAALIKEYGLGDEALLSQGAAVDYRDPYLTRRILISTETDLETLPDAARILHYGREYVLQFCTEEETRIAYATLKDSPLGENVSLDRIVFADDEQG